MSGELVTEILDYDGGRAVTVYVPPDEVDAVLYTGDGQVVAPWGRSLQVAGPASVMIVGVHRAEAETLRLHEYSPGFDPERFAAHEDFVVGALRRWVEERFGISVLAHRTGTLGVSAGGELALALGLRHPQIYGVVLCASPGAGYRPPAVMPARLPRTYLLAGTEEPFFRDNARRWAAALTSAGGDVVLKERPGTHGGVFWREELPRMVRWAFPPDATCGDSGANGG